MADILVNGNGGRGYLLSQDGTIGNEYKGCYGLQKAIDNINPGDTVKVYAPSTNKIELGNLFTLTASQMWEAGQLVRNYNGSGDDWTGIICEATETTLLIEAITGNYSNVDIADGVENTTLSINTPITGKICRGIQIDNVNGLVYDFCKITGGTVDFDKGLAFIDCQGISSYGLEIISKSFWDISWLHISNAVQNSIFCKNTCTNLNFVKCYSLLAGTIGFNLTNLKWAFIQNCVAKSSSQTGFNIGEASFLIGCISCCNGYMGISGNTIDCSFINCLIYNNNKYGILTVGRTRIIGCVIHQNGVSHPGIIVSNSTSIVMHCRITNNSEYGISPYESSAVQSFVEKYNYFQNNVSGSISQACNNGVIDETSMSGSDIDCGYVDIANDDYSLISSASMRNVAINLDWDKDYI